MLARRAFFAATTDIFAQREEYECSKKVRLEELKKHGAVGDIGGYLKERDLVVCSRVGLQTHRKLL